MPDWFKDYVRAIVARKEAEGARAIGAVPCPADACTHAEERCPACGAAL